MKIARIDPFTQKENVREIDVTQKQIDDWQSGMLIQEAMPHLCADDREFLMTGLTSESWDKLFGQDE